MPVRIAAARFLFPLLFPVQLVQQAEPNINHSWSFIIMFPEYRDLITQLKTTDRHFLNIFEKHNELDHKVKNRVSGIEPATHEEIETLKKEKLALKDELHSILRKASAA